MLTFCDALFLLIHKLGVSIKLIVWQQMVFTVLTNALIIYLSVCTVIIYQTDYYANMQFSETGTVQCPTEMKDCIGER